MKICLKTFYKLSRLPLNKIIAVEINGNRLEKPKVSLTKNNIYFNMDKVPIETIRSIYENGNFIVLNDTITIEFRSFDSKLNFNTRKFNAKNIAMELVGKYGNPNAALKTLHKLQLSSSKRKDVEDILNNLSIKGETTIMKLTIISKNTSKAAVELNKKVVVIDKSKDNNEEAMPLLEKNENAYKDIIQKKSGL